jgi:hypothetical protein
MHRLQVCLPESQIQYLAHRARREGVSIAELIRRLVDDASKSSAEQQTDSLWDIAGIGEERDPLINGTPVSERPELYIPITGKKESRKKTSPRQKRR